MKSLKSTSRRERLAQASFAAGVIIGAGRLKRRRRQTEKDRQQRMRHGADTVVNRRQCIDKMEDDILHDKGTRATAVT